MRAAVNSDRALRQARVLAGRAFRPLALVVGPVAALGADDDVRLPGCHVNDLALA